MGSQSRILNLAMKLLLTALFCGAALALPNGRVLRPEEHWRPAGARDLSKYQTRHATVSANTPNTYIDLARALRSNSKSGSTHKTASIDLQAECGIEGPPYPLQRHCLDRAPIPHHLQRLHQAQLSSIRRTPPIPMSSSPPPDGENHPITPEESPPSSEWSRIFPSSPTLNVTPSTELSETVLFALPLPEEREHATETPVAH